MYSGTCLHTPWKSHLYYRSVFADAYSRIFRHVHVWIQSMHVTYTESYRCMPYTHMHTYLHIYTRGPMPPAHMQVQRSGLTTPRARPESMVSSDIKAQRKEGRADFSAAERCLEVKIAQLGPSRRGAGQHGGPGALTHPLNTHTHTHLFCL